MIIETLTQPMVLFIIANVIISYSVYSTLQWYKEQRLDALFEAAFKEISKDAGKRQKEEFYSKFGLHTVYVHVGGEKHLVRLHSDTPITRAMIEAEMQAIAAEDYRVFYPDYIEDVVIPTTEPITR